MRSNSSRSYNAEDARDGHKHPPSSRDVLAREEPYVLESSESDPEFPAMQEFEVDSGGASGSKRKHPGLIWIVIAVIAVIVLCAVFALSGDWLTPSQAEQNAQLQVEEETVPEDLGEAGDADKL